MSEAAQLEGATAAAADRENIVVGDLIVRHKLSSRVMHWTVAISFTLCLVTGLPIWTPIFGWMSALVGGLQVCRWLHPIAGVVFAVGLAWMMLHWTSQMIMRDADKKWLSPTAIFQYMEGKFGDENVGKYNGGQKLLFWTALLMGGLLLMTGFVLWWPNLFALGLRELSLVVHDLTFIAMTVSIIGHVYLGTAAYPGTFGAMTKGTVTKAWARLHHPKWFKDVTGGK